MITELLIAYLAYEKGKKDGQSDSSEEAYEPQEVKKSRGKSYDPERWSDTPGDRS